MKMAFLLIGVLIFIIFIKYKNRICQILNLVSLPNKETFHAKKSYLYGGILLLPGIMLGYLFVILYLKENLYFNLIVIISFFSIAILDDIYDLKPLFKIFFCSLFLVISIYFDNSLRLYFLNSYFFGLFIFSENLFIIYFLPILCILLLVNAFNFIDGINCLAGLVGASILTYLVLKNNEIINYIFVFYFLILLFIFFNFKYSIFLGDSGNYLISTIIALLLIKENFYNPELYYIEEIFLLLFIPGIDMLRLFCSRIMNRKNPMHGDKNHLHHLIFIKYGFNKAIFIYLALINLPIYLYYLFQSDLAIILIITFLTYAYLVYIGFLNKYKVKT
jgi:UDP-GlcNAc:undecaprenyl-phosphate GlcNAc-1-phosphate transferase